MYQFPQLHHDVDWAMCAIRTHGAVLILDLVGRIVAVNQTCLRMCGYRRDELIGRSVLILLDPLERGANRLGHMLDTPDGAETRIASLAQVTKAGRRFRADARICPIRDDEGQVCLNVLFLRESIEEEAGPLRAILPALERPLAQIIELPARGWRRARPDVQPGAAMGPLAAITSRCEH